MRRPMRILTSVSAAALVAVGGLAGCSGSDDPGATASGAASAASSAPASPSPAASVALPSGSQWATATDSGLRFAVPDTWEPIDAETLASGGSNASVDQLLETMGVTREEFVASMQGMELMVMGPVESSFAPNVNVVPNALSELPPASNLASELDSIGATTGTPSDVSTPLGPAILVPYSLTSNELDIKGRSIVVGGPNGFVTITVSHVDDEAADAVAATLLSTLSAT